MINNTRHNNNNTFKLTNVINTKKWVVCYVMKVYSRKYDFKEFKEISPYIIEQRHKTSAVERKRVFLGICLYSVYSVFIPILANWDEQKKTRMITFLV